MKTPLPPTSASSKAHGTRSSRSQPGAYSPLLYLATFLVTVTALLLTKQDVRALVALALLIAGSIGCLMSIWNIRQQAPLHRFHLGWLGCSWLAHLCLASLVFLWQSSWFPVSAIFSLVGLVVCLLGALLCRELGRAIDQA
jgi:hypothetical protein